MFSYNIFKQNKDVLLAICDEDILGKTFSDGELEITISEFYKGKNCNATAAVKLAKNAGSVTIATDYDIEGEVIGLNVVRYIAKKTDAQRMKYSTLTKPDLIEAYKNISPTLDWGQANAGETRHILDWYWGINLSRALTIAVKTTGGFKLLSSGRVQGPALKIIVDKEKEIRAFKSEPYWEVQLVLNENNVEFIAQHEKGRFTDRNEAEKFLTMESNCEKSRKFGESMV